MAHGAPDWGVFETLSTVYRVTDLGELAARINVVNTFDRRGNLVWWDDFEDNLNKWNAVVSGGAPTYELSTTEARSGAKSCKLQPGATAGNSVGVARYAGLFTGTEKIGLELSAILNEYLRLELYIYKIQSDAYQLAQIRYDLTSSTLDLNVGGTGIVTLDSALELKPNNTWHTLKMVADFTDASVYTRLLINNLVYDLSAYSLFSSSISADDHYYIKIVAYNMADGAHPAYIDDVIITQNET